MNIDALLSDMTYPPDHRLGYVALAGRPNVGKSTLLNHLVGEKISITSRKPQTTRHRLLGVKTLSQAQIIYVDTPGLHRDAKTALNRYMNRAATTALSGVDAVIWVVEALRWSSEDQHVLQILQNLKDVPVLLAVNKIDRMEDRAQLLPYLEQCAAKFNFHDIIPLSAKNGVNLDALEQSLIQVLPLGSPQFPADQLTDRSERFLAAEMVREKLMRKLGDELPYSLSVEIERFQTEAPDKPGHLPLLRINALIWVERKSQKAIVIGKQGEVLKAVGSEARQDMERLFGCKVFLELWVKVKSGWADDERALRQFGYHDD
jgi:GTPase